MDPSSVLPAFAPQLIVSDGIAAIAFYSKAFGVKELRRFNNDVGNVHVAELSFSGTLFHLREENPAQRNLSPHKAGGNTVILGLFVDDVDSTVRQAVAAGAALSNPPTDYEYGYRQASLLDPFGHHWLIEKKLPDLNYSHKID